MIDYQEIVRLSNECNRKTLEQKESWLILENISNFQKQNIEQWLDSMGCLIIIDEEEERK
jgi:hypothetical protein